MPEMANGSGEAFDASVMVDTTPDPPDEAKIAQGIADAKATYLGEAKEAVEMAQRKLERAKGEVVHAEEILANAKSELTKLKAED